MGLSGRNGPERTGRRLPITGGAALKRCARTLASAARRARSARRVLLASLVTAAILGLPDLAHAAPPGRVFLFAFVDGQTRIDLQWSRNSTADPPVQDGGLSLERDGRDYRAGARLETDTFNLSLTPINPYLRYRH